MTAAATPKKKAKIPGLGLHSLCPHVFQRVELFQIDEPDNLLRQVGGHRHGGVILTRGMKFGNSGTVRSAVTAAAGVVLLASACGRRPAGLFRDVTRRSGVDFHYRSDLVEAKLVATMGGGAALGDFDNDGRLDLFLVNSVRNAKASSNAGNCGKLYRGRGDGTFEDVTASSGVRQCGWGVGAWWVDLDNDGWLDLYVTNLGSNELWHNNGDGTFTRAGAGRFPDDGRYSIPAAFLDANRDGRLDVFIGNYVVTSIAEEAARTLSSQKLPDEYDAPGSSFFSSGRTGPSKTRRNERASLALPAGRSARSRLTTTATA